MIAKFFCWIGFHDWLCVLRWRNGRSGMARFVCCRCDAQHVEQWDEDNIGVDDG